MSKLSLDKTVALADALRRTTPGEPLANGLQKHSFDGIAVSLTEDFLFRSLSVFYGGKLFGCYRDLELFRLRRGEPQEVTPEEFEMVEYFMEYTTETLNGLV